MSDPEPAAEPGTVPGSRPLHVRIAAAVAAVVLAAGLPVAIALLAVVDDRWRGLVTVAAVLMVAVPVVIWFTGRKPPPG